MDFIGDISGKCATISRGHGRIGKEKCLDRNMIQVFMWGGEVPTALITPSHFKTKTRQAGLGRKKEQKLWWGIMTD